MTDTQKMVHETKYFCLQHDGEYLKLWQKGEHQYYYRSKVAYPGDENMLTLREWVQDQLDSLIPLHGFINDGAIKDFDNYRLKLMDLPF